jgi:2-dehydro-3-deoxyphosphogluconate aldolase / (4S)-4-hydroxy-2-oxoglutarate aldolase
MRKQKAIQAILEQKLLPLFYHDSAETSIEVLNALYQAGIRTVEYTNRGEHALENFRKMKKAIEANMPGLLLGIGTIKNREEAESFIEAGADFIICPTVNTEVARVTHDKGMLWIPGCLTPTEIATAEMAGATIIKIFPGNILGPGYISAIRELFPKIKFMPTGGVEAEEGNLRSWFNAGVVAVGLGSKLVSKEIMENKNYDHLRKRTEEALSLIAGLKN